MRIEPKSAAIASAGMFSFLLIFGLAWPGPGTWLLVFSLLFIAVGAAAWWLDGTLVTSGGGVVASGRGATPFRAGARGRGAGRPGDSLLLALGLPGPDGSGRWVLPDRVHVTVVAALIGTLAMIIFISGAVSGGGSGETEPVLAEQSNAALDFAQPLIPIVQASTGVPLSQATSPIVVETPSTTRPEPARPLEVTELPAEPAQMLVHEVVSGDTIYDLAIEHETSIEAIMNANGIGEFDTIRVGEQLLIPVSAS